MAILFLEDWRKYPSAIIDTSTNNKSFIRLALLYKEMGIKNYGFPLALHNPTLQGIDPFDPNLTMDQITDIVTEVGSNPWYFLRECVRIKAPGSLTGINLQANRANIAHFWLNRNHVTNMLIQPRQTGKTLIADLDTIWVLNTKTNIKMVLITKDNGLRVKNINAIKELLNELPWYLNRVTKNDSNNSENITVNALSNRLDVLVGQESEAGALKVGRGVTSPIMKNDEGPFMPMADISIPVALAATGAAREAAKLAGSEYYNAFTTTPGYLNTRSGRYFKTIYDSCVRWTERLLDSKNEEELHEVIKMNSKTNTLRVLVEFNHRQLGKTDEWLRERIKETMNEDRDKVEADYFNKWSQGSLTSPISKESREALVKSRMEPKYTDISKEGYITKWYIPESEINNLNRKIVMGLDSSELIGSDGTNICLRDVTTGEVIATGSYNDTNSITLSRFLANLLIRFPTITLIPETKSTGVSIVDNIIDILFAKDIDPFKRIFNFVVQDMEVDEEYKAMINSTMYNKARNYEVYRKQFGYRTSGSGRTARDNLYGSTFNNFVKYTSHLVRDAETIDQLLSLVNNNGRIDHPKGGHDDACVAAILCQWMLLHGKNLHIYGIDHSEVLINAKLQGVDENGGITAEIKKRKQERIRDEINTLSFKLKTVSNDMVRNQIRNRLLVLYSNLEHEDIVAMNLEELLNSLKTEKSFTRSARSSFSYS